MRVRYFPVYSICNSHCTDDLHPQDEGQLAWRIGNYEGGPVVNLFQIPFASKRDCEIAIRSLCEAGMDDFSRASAMSKEELFQITTEHLKW